MACAAVALALALLHGAAFGHRTLLHDGDSTDQSFMWLSKVFAATHEHTVALWDAPVFSGTSFIGELQTAPLYPPAVIFGLFAEPGSVRAVDWFLLLHFAVAACGGLILARALGLTTVAGLAGATIFAFGSTFTFRVAGQPNLFASLAWMPWIHWAIVRAASAASVRAMARYVGAGAIAIALGILAGHVHGVVLALAGSLLLGLATAAGRSSTSRGRTRAALSMLAALAAMTALASALAAPQLVATNEYLRLAYKWYGPSYTSYPHVVPYEQFAAGSLHAPDLATALSGREINAPDGGTLYVTHAGLALAGAALVLAAARRRLRFVTAGAGAMAVLGLGFAFSPVIGLGPLFSALPGINLIRLPARGLFLYAAGMSILAALGADQIAALGRGSGRGRRIAAIAILCGLVAWVGWGVAEWAPSVERDGLGPEMTAILHGPISAALEDAAAGGPLEYRYFGPRELVPPNLGDLRRVLSTAGYRSSQTIAYHEDFSLDPHRLDEYAVRWLVTTDPQPGLRTVGLFGRVAIQERTTALPVFWLARGDADARAPIHDIAWRQNQVRVEFSEPVAGRLVFAQSVFPGWTATAGGVSLPVTDHRGMMAVDLPDAVRTVSFTYRPVWLAWTTTVAVMAWLAAGGALWFGGARGKSRAGN